MLDPCKGTAEWMNKVFQPPGHYYVRWDSDIILSNEAFPLAYETVRDNQADVAGVNGWKTVKRRIGEKEIDQITFGEPPGIVEGVDSFWIMQADKWQTCQINGCPWGDPEKLYMKQHLLCVNLDVSYLHLRHDATKRAFEHYDDKRKPLIFGSKK